MFKGGLLKLEQYQIKSLPNWLSQPDQITRAIISRKGKILLVAPILKIQNHDFLELYKEEIDLSKTTKINLYANQLTNLPCWILEPDEINRVDILRLWKHLVLVPLNTNWDNWFNGPCVTDNFMNEREQPPMQERENLC